MERTIWKAGNCTDRVNLSLQTDKNRTFSAGANNELKDI